MLNFFNRNIVYSEPFLMSDDCYSAHYYQWSKNVKTNEGKLIKVCGQKAWGITVNNAIPGLLFKDAVFITPL